MSALDLNYILFCSLCKAVLCRLHTFQHYNLYFHKICFMDWLSPISVSIFLCNENLCVIPFVSPSSSLMMFHSAVFPCYSCNFQEIILFLSWIRPVMHMNFWLLNFWNGIIVASADLLDWMPVWLLYLTNWNLAPEFHA
jgi:hypothetical protein